MVTKRHRERIHGASGVVEAILLEAHHVHLLHVLQIEAARGTCRELRVLTVRRKMAVGVRVGARRGDMCRVEDVFIH